MLFAFSRLPMVRFIAFVTALAAASAHAADEPIPRFDSLRADKVNLRTGPGEQYPVEWVYERKGWPVEVTGQFDVWRKIRDSDGTEGWVHERMLTAVRAVVVTGAIRTLHGDPDAQAPVVARLEPGVVAKLLACQAQWCQVEAQDIKGWLLRSDVWGVYPNETVQ